MENMFSAINLIASFCSIISVFGAVKFTKIKRIFQGVVILNAILLLIVGVLSATYFKTIDARQRAAEYNERYENISFESDLPGTKIKTAVADGIVIITDLDFEHKYPVIYNNVVKKYEEANSEKIFNRDKYVEIARELFGALGNLSKDLYKKDYYNKN